MTENHSATDAASDELAALRVSEPVKSRGGCRVIDDASSSFTVIEDAGNSGATPQALIIRVGVVFDNGVERAEPGIWVEYQEAYYESDVSGPVLLTPAAWEQLTALIDDRLSRRDTMTRAERFTRAVRAVHLRYKEARAEVTTLQRENVYLKAELQRCQAAIQAQETLVDLAEDVLWIKHGRLPR